MCVHIVYLITFAVINIIKNIVAVLFFDNHNDFLPYVHTNHSNLCTCILNYIDVYCTYIVYMSLSLSVSSRDFTATAAFFSSCSFFSVAFMESIIWTTWAAQKKNISPFILKTRKKNNGLILGYIRGVGLIAILLLLTSHWIYSSFSSLLNWSECLGEDWTTQSLKIFQQVVHNNRCLVEANLLAAECQKDQIRLGTRDGLPKSNTQLADRLIGIWLKIG